jgi:hypothetical protein
MVYQLRQSLNRLRLFLARERQRGKGLLRALALDLPRIVATKGYAKLARQGNGRVINKVINYSRFRTFQSKHAERLGGHFYLIVMPGTLHFLLPCLALVPNHVKLFLLYNGTHRWEENYLKRIWPNLPAFNLSSLPGSSLTHGDVLTLLLRTNRHNFGILDHDLYVFEESLFDRLEFNDNECALAIFGGRSKTGVEYPHSQFVFFNSSRLREIMQRYRVDARSYRRAPSRLQAKLDRIGLTKGVYLKDYHNYFDTLHLLFSLAFYEGQRVGFIPLQEPSGVFHVGGTSVGSHRTTDLAQLYIRQRFLEFVDSDELTQHYSYLYDSFHSSADLRRRLPRCRDVLATLDILDELMQRLDESRTVPYIAMGQSL